MHHTLGSCSGRFTSLGVFGAPGAGEELPDVAAAVEGVLVPFLGDVFPEGVVEDEVAATEKIASLSTFFGVLPDENFLGSLPGSTSERNSRALRLSWLADR
jgi:hypothetical protein